MNNIVPLAEIDLDKKHYFNNMKTSLKENLKNYITSYKPREELRNFGEYLGFDAENTGRQLRHLTREGKIKRVWKGKYIIGYEPVATPSILSLKTPKMGDTELKWNETIKPLYVTKEEQKAIGEAESKQGVLI